MSIQLLIDGSKFLIFYGLTELNSFGCCNQQLFLINKLHFVLVQSFLKVSKFHFLILGVKSFELRFSCCTRTQFSFHQRSYQFRHGLTLSSLQNHFKFSYKFSDGWHRGISIYFQDWDRQNPTQVVTEMCGFVTILSGTFLLHKTKDMADGMCAISFLWTLHNIWWLLTSVLCLWLPWALGSCRLDSWCWTV